MRALLAATVALAFVLLGCNGSDAIPVFGPVGLAPAPGSGPQGPAGAVGKDGAPGVAGKDGAMGKTGPAGKDGKDAAQSGSRLKARYLVGDDGSRQPNGDWLDTTTGEPCTYQKANDDETRCLPALFVAANSGAYYLDDSCTQLVLSIYDDSGNTPVIPKYGQTHIKITGDVIYIKAGALLPDPATIYYEPSPGTCAAVNGFDPVPYFFFTVDEELQADFFIAASIITD